MPATEISGPSATWLPSQPLPEEKRVVFQKKRPAPLISARDEPLHPCTRCVRFDQEIAGVMELGMIHRGEYSGDHHLDRPTVDSELSGNASTMPGRRALTSKPFHGARTWGSCRRKERSATRQPFSANLIVQVKANQGDARRFRWKTGRQRCWIAIDRQTIRGLNGDRA